MIYNARNMAHKLPSVSTYVRLSLLNIRGPDYTLAKSESLRIGLNMGPAFSAETRGAQGQGAISCERSGLLVTPPNLELDHRSSSWVSGALKPAKLAVFIVSRKLLTDCLTDFGLRSSDIDMTYRALEPSAVLLPLAQALLADLLEGSPEGKDATEQLAKTLVGRLLLHCRDPVRRRQVDDPIARVCRHIEANLHEPLNLQCLSDVAGMSQFHFCRVFHGTVGKSPHQYVMSARIDAARRLIWDPVAFGGSRQSMLDVALACGFGSSSHFSTQFRKHTGQSPLEWRAAQLTRRPVQTEGTSPAPGVRTHHNLIAAPACET